MSRRDIERALRAKDIQWVHLQYGWQATPGEMVPGWDLILTSECEDEIALHDPDFDDWEPDFRNTAEVLEWIETLPDLRSASTLTDEAKLRRSQALDELGALDGELL